MAAYDITLYSAADECASRQGYRTNITAATFHVGEPVIVLGNVLVDGDGGPGGVDPVAIAGIALEDAVSRSNRMAALEVADTLRIVELPDPNKVFVARYFATDGAGTHATPTFAGVAGVPGNLVYEATGDTWTFDTGAVNINCEGIDVLDTDGNRLGNDITPHGTGTVVLFRFI
ncbi:MAG: hypothetical protein A2139_02365 [Desulfobacca sp. RBG_16_60_12]|nr:MAG: hypothetical protein A2139_02365 [Desulfobacca sp. RBG_16_60_12]